MFPVDRPPIEHGVVTVDGERIVAVGTKAEDGEAIELGSVALCQGSSTAHTSGIQLFAPAVRQTRHAAVDWIRLVIAERGRASTTQSDSLLRGLQESLSCGVTTVGDITTSVPGLLPGMIDLTLFHEVIGYSLRGPIRR